MEAWGCSLRCVWLQVECVDCSLDTRSCRLVKWDCRLRTRGRRLVCWGCRPMAWFRLSGAAPRCVAAAREGLRLLSGAPARMLLGQAEQPLVVRRVSTGRRHAARRTVLEALLCVGPQPGSALRLLAVRTLHGAKLALLLKVALAEVQSKRRCSAAVSKVS